MSISPVTYTKLDVKIVQDQEWMYIWCGIHTVICVICVLATLYLSKLSLVNCLALVQVPTSSAFYTPKNAEGCRDGRADKPQKLDYTVWYSVHRA